MRRLLNHGDQVAEERLSHRKNARYPRAVPNRDVGVSSAMGNSVPVACRLTTGCSGRPAARPAAEPERWKDQWPETNDIAEMQTQRLGTTAILPQSHPFENS